MAKKSQSEKDGESKAGRKSPWVVSSEGGRQRFLRGMITHDLVQRGLSFDDAYAAAKAVRDRLEDRKEVTTSEIRELIGEQLEKRASRGLVAALSDPVRAAPLPQVIYHGQPQPFSRGLLARSMYAAGLTLDRAYRLVTELERKLKEEGVSVLTSHEVARRVGELLARMEGEDRARRYRLVRRVHRLPRPLVIYVGGASGTGKSTLALELAPLLRIYRINATDTIRQVMRMVFSKAILPELHASSFEVAAALDELPSELPRGHPRDPAYRQRLIATFEKQATRVCVGVRAVVERAIAENMSILVEGVHLYPPLIPFADLEKEVYQVTLMLGTLNEEAHRSRFLLRSRTGGRLAERYVESFPSIRAIHDFLIQQAEIHDIALLDNSNGEPPVVRSLRLVTGLLERRLPSLARSEPAERMTPTLLLAIDGLADRPVAELGGRTPLQAASTPTLDRLVREGQGGLADPVGPGIVSDMASGILALFGHSPISMKRGPIEAMGAGIRLSPGDVAVRGNFALLDAEGNVVNRRALLESEEVQKLAKALDRMPLPRKIAKGVEVRVKPAGEHRLAIVLRGEGLSSEIRGSDPGESSTPVPPRAPTALAPNDPRAVFTAKLLGLFERETRRILEKHSVNVSRKSESTPLANAILTRGAGRAHRLLPLEHAGIPLRLTCVSGDQTMLALAAWLGADAVTKDGTTENLGSDLEGKLSAAAEALGRCDLVVVHLRGAHVAARERRPDRKVAFLEAVDRHLARFLEQHRGPLRVAVASDHATLSETGEDVADPLPVLIWGEGIEPDDVQAFDEKSVATGQLGRFPLQLLLGNLFELT
ncbi:MAG TPA: hypothetical protein VLK65_26580 [Vicinamibacteria bacterium]|nr:hypothetical protein [Vicinamibacteria bacterium]